jgi:hypothetical protein
MTSMFEVTTTASGEVHDADGNLLNQEPAPVETEPTDVEAELIADGEVQE